MALDFGTEIGRRPTNVTFDVTTVISAEEYIVSANHIERPRDPFARQCFAELVQSILFMSQVLIPHPVLLSPRDVDYGDQPRLLRLLMSAGLLQPLTLPATTSSAATAIEDDFVSTLGGPKGRQALQTFIDQALSLDSLAATPSTSLSSRISAWCDFQAANVRVVGGHRERITTSDGVESDAFGAWARAAATVFAGDFARIGPSSEAKYIAATLVRGLKYLARAEASGIAYQSHPMRRDFLTTFDLIRAGEDEEHVLGVIKAVRGIFTSIADAVGPDETSRVRLLELQLPLLGGRLWKSADVRQMDDMPWMELVVERLRNYRDRLTPLREPVEACVSDEDYLRLTRDLEVVRRDVLERIGVRDVALAPIERDLADGVASVAETVPGLPRMSAVWVAARTSMKRLHASSGPAHMRFLYREFIRAWREARQ